MKICLQQFEDITTYIFQKQHNKGHAKPKQNCSNNTIMVIMRQNKRIGNSEIEYQQKQSKAKNEHSIRAKNIYYSIWSDKENVML